MAGEEVFNIRYVSKIYNMGNSFFLRLPRELIISNNLKGKKVMVRLILEEVLEEETKENKKEGPQQEEDAPKNTSRGDIK